MPRLHVCSLARLHETASSTGASHLVTLLSPGGVSVVRPSSIDPDRHLAIGVSDIAEPLHGHTHASADHIDRLLAFARAWDRRAPLLIHCYAGVSRSTAAAFVAVCALAPDRDEREVAGALRRASPTATPNTRLVALADEALGRSGRMVAAIEAIGRGAECFEGAPFALSLRAHDAPAESNHVRLLRHAVSEATAGGHAQ